jgi:hypothetical protein
MNVDSVVIMHTMYIISLLECMHCCYGHMKGSDVYD